MSQAYYKAAEPGTTSSLDLKSILASMQLEEARLPIVTLKVNSSVTVDVSSSYHVFDLVVGERFSEVQHHVTQFRLTDEPSRITTATHGNLCNIIIIIIIITSKRQQ